DLVEGGPIDKVVLGGLGPTPKDVIDREKLELWILAGVLGQDVVVALTKEMRGGDFLSGVAVQKSQVLRGHFTRAALVDDLVNDRDGGFSEDADRGHDDFKLVATEFLDQQQLVFPVDENVPQTALHKSSGRTACAGIQHGHMLEELSDELLRFFLR